ncbi:DUF3189 family protein [Bacillus sp. JJ722]|uniref:DUF3189 family protein n=1 Tax=Bacillus sp. JJ722 TaxID=3122973 RepID=UPI002FFEAA87
MIYIYNDYGGTHTTSLAAAHHLGMLPPPTHTLSKEEILAVPYFNELTRSDFGKLIFHGNDEMGDSVYTIGRKSSKLVVPSLKELGLLLLNRFNIEERIIFSNTSPTVPISLSIGGFFSRGLGIDSIGVPFLIKGAQKCNKTIYDLVNNTKNIAASMEGKILILENQDFKS